MITEDLKNLSIALNEGKTVNQICDSLTINRNELFCKIAILKSFGKLYKSNYYSSGEIIYKPITSINTLEDYYKGTCPIIITGYDEEKIDFLVLSDLHIGNNLSNIELTKYAYDYMLKNNIHLSLLLGDIIDGTFSKVGQNIADVSYQIYEFLNKYPFDKNILTFGVLGDHDLSALESEGINLIDAIKYARNDIVINKYFNDKVNIKNDSILLMHKANALDKPSLTLEGHFHLFDTKMEENKLTIKVPSLSKINYSEANAIHLTLEFNKGYIERVNIKALNLGSNVNIIKKEEHFFKLSEKDIKERVINEEGYTKKLNKINSDRINKFNKKYGL